MNNSKICCQPYTSNHFVDVDGTILIKPKCTYTSNGIDIIEKKSIGNDIFATYCIVINIYLLLPLTCNSLKYSSLVCASLYGLSIIELQINLLD